MSQSESNSDKSSASRSPESALKEIIEGRLDEAGARVARSTTVEEGIKACYEEGHTNPANQTLPGLIDGNYTIHGGDGLVIFDIDVDDLTELPDWVRELPSTFEVESPHGGYHRYYLIEDDSGISNTQTDWGSIQYGRYCVGPGSTIDHARCRDGKRNCPDEGLGRYDITADKPIETLSGEDLENLRGACSDSTIPEVLEVPEDPEEDDIDTTQRALQDLQTESTPGFNRVMGFLQGGTADFNDDRLTKDTGQIDRSSAVFIALSLLYGTLTRYTDHSPADCQRTTYHAFTHYCREHPWTEDGQRRRWLLEDDDWRHERLSYAIDQHEPERFEYLISQHGVGTSARRENNEYSELTYGAIWTALYDLIPEPPICPPTSNDMDPGNPATEEPETGGGPMVEQPEVHKVYPDKSQVIDRAYEIDDGYNEWDSYEEAFRRLQADYGEVKAARIGSSTWVFYPTEYPDPPEACSVLQYGETYDPDVAEGINSWTGEPEIRNSETEEDAEQQLMTDGGTRTEVSDAKRDIKRVRQVREKSVGSTEGPELYRCPIEGCSRTVIDDPSSLRSHVRQAGDDAHRFRTLNEDLDIEIDEEQYHASWGPGMREQISTEPESIYEPDDPWGPGAPKSEPS